MAQCRAADNSDDSLSLCKPVGRGRFLQFGSRVVSGSGTGPVGFQCQLVLADQQEQLVVNVTEDRAAS
ncbi:hypothetical protein C8035_v003602 [Colletotrichum spinosum]|uniref:Uncharacterized protein n=1 Tax=Colletotrichum spinosum TaxID=1347390 RepID=A0A4R8QTS0_9PEZI|nr:hypothetical protein C8035_v003602 [Colletotrichum spinosum]